MPDSTHKVSVAPAGRSIIWRDRPALSQTAYGGSGVDARPAGNADYAGNQPIEDRPPKGSHGHSASALPAPKRRSIIARALSDFLTWLDSGTLPDCPACGGSGSAYDARSRTGWTCTVYWRGVPMEVCDQCSGTGKV